MHNDEAEEAVEDFLEFEALLKCAAFDGKVTDTNYKLIRGVFDEVVPQKKGFTSVTDKVIQIVKSKPSKKLF